MDQRDSKTGREEKGSQTEEKFHFLDQTIKEPSSRERWMRQLGQSLVLAVLIGLVASFVFVAVLPVAERMAGRTQGQEKIDIPEDDMPVVSSSSSPGRPEEASSPVPEGSKEATASGSDGGEPSGESALGDDSGEKPGQAREGEAESGTILSQTNLYKELMRVAGEAEHSMVQVTGIRDEMDYFHQSYENQSQVSGLIVAVYEGGLYILTEYRAVQNVKRIQVSFYDGGAADGTYIRSDSNTGLAMIKVREDALSDVQRQRIRPASLGNSYTVSRGEPILALGSPLGYNKTVMLGMVTSIQNTVSLADTEYSVLMTDIQRSEEGSGVLIDLEGNVVGIISPNAGRSDATTMNALAISQLKSLIEKLSNNESRAYLGIKGQEVTDDIAAKTGIPKGLLLTEVAADSPAMLSGLKEYDVMVRFNGMDLSSMRNFSEALAALKPGESAEILAMRKGTDGYEEVTFSAVVGES